jgi:hypothetical protein
MKFRVSELEVLLNQHRLCWPVNCSLDCRYSTQAAIESEEEARETYSAGSEFAGSSLFAVRARWSGSDHSDAQ